VNSAEPDVLKGFHQALQLIVDGSPVVVQSTLTTLHLAVVATAIATVLGVPCGCLLGIGKSRVTRLLRGLATVVARVPPVGTGVLALILVTEESQWGGGPLAGLHWYLTPNSVYLAQTMLALPIVVVLTTSAVEGVPAGLLDQAGAYGASRLNRAALAAREARRAVLAGVIVAMGVTITAIGAIVTTEVPNFNTLALRAFQALTEGQPGEPAPFNAHAAVQPATYSLAVAFATVLIGLFVVVAGMLTWLQERRSGWFGGVRYEQA
jgi:tungstate transport system permease protein